ncbi:MAG TPA: DEAD/DEAH box helicase [Rhodospirillales bacterium]|nr:DEAD/DEAH box helicase [Rhodospirillales bacterium]
MGLHTFDDIRRTVSPATLDKAAAYQRRRRAVVTDISPDGTRIRGRVQGSLHRPYSVVVDLRSDTAGEMRIAGTCSCPIGYNCKHVAALLIESMSSSKHSAPALPPVEPLVPSPATGWLSELDRAMALSEDDYPPSIRQRLLYVLSLSADTSGPTRAVLELKSVRLRKDDSFGDNAGTFDPRSAFSSSPAKHLRGADLPILRRLQDARGPYGYASTRAHPLAGDIGAEVLQRVLATGRCRWGSLQGPVMALGAPRQGSIGWALLDDGGQKPAVSVQGGGTAVCLIPPWYIDADAAVCGPLQFHVPPRVAATLMQAPPIEPQQVAALRGELAGRLPGRGELLPPEPTPARVVGGPPVPVLCLTRQPLRPLYGGFYAGGYAGASWAQPPAPLEIRTARLAFAYGPVVIAAGDRRDRPMLAREGGLLAIDRDRARERNARERLNVADGGLVPLLPHQLSALPPEARGDLVLNDDDDAMAWPRFLVEVAPRLRSEGWRIEIEPGFVPPLVEADGDVDAILRQGSGIDWFEADIGIQVDGQRVNLLPKIVELLKLVPADASGDFFDLDDDEPQTLFVTLDDGRLLPLPYARVKPILTALHELFRVDLALNGDGLGFNRSRAGELAAFEERIAAAGIAWSGNEALRLLGQRLREGGPAAARPAPQGFAATLRPYQSEGFGWLGFLGEIGLGGILADDMGLGKTVQALAHVLAEKRDGRADRPSLVVAPTSLMANWRMEAARFAPELRVLTLHGPDRKACFDAVPAHDLVLTTYALLPRDRDVLQAQPWHALLVDEAQNVKNPDTNAARILRRLEARQRFCLTGTPVENHLGELWALMDFLNPGLLGDRRQFVRAFRAPIEKNNDGARRQVLARRIRPFLLRRTKAQVATELPPKTEIVEHVEMEAGQSAIYEAVRLTMHRKVRDAIAAKGLDRSRIIILDALLKLRQVCCDPRLVKLPSVKKAGAGSAKLSRLMEMLGELVEEGRRVLLFSQFTSMLALIEERLTAAGIAFVKITGDVVDRATPVARFQAGDVPVFLISLKAGGTGLNLTAADTVILYDPWWNPAVEAQAIDRSHRIGQDKPVFVHRLVTLQTIEEKMLELQQRKGALAAGLLDAEAAGPLDITAGDIELLLGAT